MQRILHSRRSVAQANRQGNQRDDQQEPENAESGGIAAERYQQRSGEGRTERKGIFAPWADGRELIRRMLSGTPSSLSRLRRSYSPHPRVPCP